MKNRYLQAFISASLSIIPMIFIILILSWTKVAPLNFARGDYWLLLIGMVVLITGLGTFSIGASSSLSKVGEYMGSSLSKQKNLFIVIAFSFALGALITVAEPSIMIVTKQVTDSTVFAYILTIGIAVGVGLFVVIGVLRIIFQKSLKLWYLFFYALTFMILIFVVLTVRDKNDKSVFLPFIFDSGGVTTGSATVPFILALGTGVATVRGGKNAKNNSFGLVGMASIGPIISVTLLIIFSSTLSPNFVPSYAQLGNENIFKMFIYTLFPHKTSDSFSLGTSIEVLIAMAPTLIIFLIYNAIFIKLPKHKIFKLLIAFLFAYIGLSIFLCGTGAAMTPIGYYVGTLLGLKSKVLIVIIALLIGLVTIVCEPAVHVLTVQIEEVSDGRVRRLTVLLTLSIGVGLAIALAVIRTIYNFSILYYMVPGYIISLTLMFLCPDIFTAMAFDSGGTASGPMASSFVLPMIVGLTTAIYAENANYFEQSFGVIALIALTPIIAIQVLGVIEKIKDIKAKYSMRKHVYNAEDAQIIHFN